MLYIVHGRTVDEHDRRLEKAMERIQDRGQTLNKEKCKFQMSELEFVGHLLSALGKEQEVAFNESKKRLANTETLGYFDITVPAQ